MRSGSATAALLCALLWAAYAQAFDVTDTLSVSGYMDARAIAPTDQASWINGGLGKFRFGGDDGGSWEGVGQIEDAISDKIAAIGVIRAEPQTPGLVNALEAYLRYNNMDSQDLSFTFKAGAFFPTISLENDDLGWTSPYTLTPSAINSWIGDELRTMGVETMSRWHSGLGTVSLIGALFCCNEEAGILIADRGWSMDDRPSGLFGRLRLPEATEKVFSRPLYATTGMFDEIDDRLGWYAGVTWQAPEFAKLSVLRYDNEADPSARTITDTAWHTGFWSFGARSDFGPLVLIAQALTGETQIKPSPLVMSDTKFQSAFLLASYDLEDWRLSAREDVFQTRHSGETPSPFSEDATASTASISWSSYDWWRVSCEIIAMNSRREEYVLAGLGSPQRLDTQVQLDSRFFF